MTLNIQDPQPIDPELGTEEVLPGLPNVSEILDSLQYRLTRRQEDLVEYREQRDHLNSRLAEERARLAAEASQERTRLNAEIAEAIEEIAQLERLLKASQKKTRKPKKATT